MPKTYTTPGERLADLVPTIATIEDAIKSLDPHDIKTVESLLAVAAKLLVEHAASNGSPSEHKVAEGARKASKIFQAYADWIGDGVRENMQQKH